MKVLLLLIAPVAFAQSPAKPDVWERTKDCAAQAEKVMAGDLRFGPYGSSVVAWRNHYSQKQERCLIRAVYAAKSEKDDPRAWNILVDAFERGALAQSAFGTAAAADCANAEQNITSCEAMLKRYGCFIGLKGSACAEAEAFISDQMKD